MKHGLLRIVSTPQKSTARGFFPRGRTSARPHLGFFGRIAMPLLARLSATLSAAVWQAALSLDDSLASWGTSGLGGFMISLVRDISLKEVGMNTSSRWLFCVVFWCFRHGVAFALAGMLCADLQAPRSRCAGHPSPTYK